MRFVVSDKISSSSSSSSFTLASSFLDTKIFLLLFLPNFDKDCFFDEDDEKEEEEEIVGAPLAALFKAERERNVVISSSLLNFARNKEREDEMILF